MARLPPTPMKQRQRNHHSRTMQRLRVQRFDPVREVACEQCEIAYGAVGVAHGRPLTIEDVNPRTGERVVERVIALRLSYESTESDNDSSGFLPKPLLRAHREQGFATRQAQKDLAAVCGMRR